MQETLQQNLIGQLNQSVLSADDRKAAELIIGNIDDNGFLQSTPEEMALNSGIPKEDFEKMLALIQGFYPAGVGAHDLRECLLIQLQRQGKEHSLEYKIVSEHMEDLGRRRFPEIARRMGISVEEVQKAADNIARLNPRPGQVFAAAPQNYVLPDVMVEKVDGEYQIAQITSRFRICGSAIYTRTSSPPATLRPARSKITSATKSAAENS